METENNSPFIRFSDPRLSATIDTWNEFVKALSPGERIGLIYHADIDGLIGTAYSRKALSKHVPVEDMKVFWISTDEYDFQSLRDWVQIQMLDHCILMDISVENHAPTLDFLCKHVRKGVFIYDHHIVTNDGACCEKIALANPTPGKLSANEIPLPTFLFAFKLAQSNQIPFPDWLLLMAIFAEGVTDFFEPETKVLFERVLGLAYKDNTYDTFRGTRLARFSSLIKASFTTGGDQRSQKALRLLDKVIGKELLTIDDFDKSLSFELSEVGSGINDEISTLADYWKARIEKEADLLKKRVIVIPLDTTHAVSGPVASILRGHFPDKIIATYIRQDDKVIFEFRTRNDTDLNLAKILDGISREVPMINYGGHPSAAGALLRQSELEVFLRKVSDGLANHIADQG